MKPERPLTARYADLLIDPSDDALNHLVQELDTAYTAPARPAGLSWPPTSQRLELVPQQTLGTRTPFVHARAKRGRKTALLAFAAILALAVLSATLFTTIGASWSRQNRQAQTPSALFAADALLLQQLLQNKGTPASIRNLAQSDQFARVNLTLGSGNVEIQKVYADANNVVIGYTIDTSVWQKDTFCTLSQLPSQCVPAVCSLTIMTSENQTLPCYGNLANFGTEARYTNKRVAVLAYYDTSSIQGNPHHLQLKVLLTKKGSSSGEAYGDVTVPFHAAKTVIPVNQTVTSPSNALTLERVVITPTEARFYNSPIASSSISPVTLSIAGKTYDPDNFHIAWHLANAYEWAVTSARRGNSVGFYDALLGKKGTWILTEAGEVMNPYHNDTWTFTFTVS